MMIHERQYRQARYLKSIQGKTNTDALSAVSILKEGVITEITAQADIEEACHLENRSKC